MTKTLFCMALLALAGCVNQKGDLVLPDGVRTEAQDDKYWDDRKAKECGGIDDGIMKVKCLDAINRERRKGYGGQ